MLLMAVIKSNFLWLAVIAGINIVISLYYYLMVVKRIFVDAPETSSPIPVSFSMRLLLGFAILGIVAIGIFQGPFLDATMTSIQGMHLIP